MNAPKNIIDTWNKFSFLPMETITKAWNLKNFPRQQQRSIQTIINHHKRSGASGNCFDLAIWLIHEFKRSNIETYAIGENLGTKNAHIAVIAKDDKNIRYLCDLGDSWIKPILIEDTEKSFCKEPQKGFFPGAEVKIEFQSEVLNITYLRKNGKFSTQKFNLSPLKNSELLEAANISQQMLSPPLIEKKLYSGEEVTLWEFDNYKSFSSTSNGLITDSLLNSNTEWAKRIAHKTQIDTQYILDSLDAFQELSIQN
ncbi:MAG: hypothetical protein HON90_13600 [Halobacteriovoraceae bacterium]|nr:hypothetical protein [Halobacteriovoraceae bacterium]